MRIFVTASTISVDRARRQLRGTLVRYGELGHTNVGPLRFRPGSIEIPGDLPAVDLTREHDFADVRGSLALVDDNAERMYVGFKVADGPEGDIALEEADGPTRVRAGLSLVVEVLELDAEGWVVKARLVNVGQVENPAFNSSRIDLVAASHTSGTSRATNEGDKMTPEQIARLAELLGLDTRTPEQETELQSLVALMPAPADQAAAAVEAAAAETAAAETAAAAAAVETAAAETVTAGTPAAPAPVTASAVPGGQSTVTASTTTVQPRGVNALDQMISGMVDGLRTRKAGGNPLPLITAALTDVTNTAHTDKIEQKGWSGELFSGVEYQPIFSPNLEPGPLDNWEGKGWRFKQTPAVQDYAGDKAAIPSGSVVTEESLWEAAIGAVGIDIDRKFFDFPNGEFLKSLFEAMAESVVILRDQKSGLYITSEAIEPTKKVTVATTNADATIVAPAGAVTAAYVGRPVTGAGIPANTTVLSFTDATHFELSANATATAGAVVIEVGLPSPSLLKAAARVAQSLTRRYNGTKAPASPSSGPDYLYVNDEDWFGMLDINQFEVPTYLSAYGIKPETFIPTEDVPSGFVIGGVKKAAKLRTEKNPIVIDALNIAQGGVDKAFHTYWAIEQQHLRGVQKAHFSAVVEA